MFTTNYPLLSVCLNEVFFFYYYSVWVLKSLSVSTRLSNTVIRRWGHLVSLPNRYRSPNFAGSNKLSRYFHVIYRSAESKENYLQLRRFRRCWKNYNFILIYQTNQSSFIQHEQREAYNVNGL